MKLYTYLLLTITFLVVSCKKTTQNYFKVGDTNNCLVISHDTTTHMYVQANNPDYGILGIDIDNNGSIDFYFTSYSYSTYFFTSIIVNNTPKIVGAYPWANNKIELAVSQSIETKKVLGSEFYYFHVGETIWDFYGSYPRSTSIREKNYIHSPIADFFNERPSISYLKNNEAITNLSEFEQIQEYTIYRNEQFTSQWTYTGANYNDTLNGFVSHSVPKMGNLPLNQIIYIPFKLLRMNKKYPGWLELKITDNYRITVFRSAVSNISEDEL